MSQRSRSGFGGRGLSRLDTERKEVLRIQASAYNERTQSMSELAARSSQAGGGAMDLDVEVRSGAVPEAVRENKVPLSYDFSDENQANMARIAAARAGGANTAQLREMISRINAEANARREGQQAALNDAMERARRARDPDATHFHAVVPINDFPQRARWNVTNKETMAMLIQSTGASITSKGAFYDRGKEPKPGDPPKLSLLIESNEQYRIEDAVRNAKAAAEEGIVAGGGSALIHAAHVLDGDLHLEGDEKAGVQIVAKAVREPLRWIAENGGEPGYVIVSKVAEMEPGHGYNGKTGQYVDLIADGVIDPLKVTRSALANAASIASLLLTTETLVVDKPEEDNEDK